MSVAWWLAAATGVVVSALWIRRAEEDPDAWNFVFAVVTVALTLIFLSRFVAEVAEGIK